MNFIGRKKKNGKSVKWVAWLPIFFILPNYKGLKPTRRLIPLHNLLIIGRGGNYMSYGYPQYYGCSAPYPYPYPPPCSTGGGAWYAFFIVIIVLVLIFGGWWYFNECYK
jgi:hypothetical protein